MKARFLTTSLPWVLPLAALLLPEPRVSAQAATVASARSARAPEAVLLLSIQGDVEVLRAGTARWTLTTTSSNRYEQLLPGDALRVSPRGHALLSLPNGSTMRVEANGSFRVERPRQATSRVFLLRGLFYFFHRGRPGDTEVDGPTVTAAVLGTEYHVEVAEDQTATFSLIDGQVEMRRSDAPDEVLTLRNGEAGVAAPGQPLQRTAVLDATALIQWCLYYPGILDPAELALPPEAANTLRASLDAYRRGHLVRALALYPTNRQPAVPTEAAYLAGLHLGVGGVREAEALLATIPPGDTSAPHLAQALQILIRAVRGDVKDVALPPPNASALLAESYRLQAAHQLGPALAAARQAVAQSPDFGFGWARVAELEFGHGRLREVRQALSRALAAAPENPQAIALNGFVLAADNRIPAARAQFASAIELDSRLGHGWLGRGLCRIRQGDLKGGVADLQIAAAMEPRRALLRAYLGKGFQEAGRVALAEHELELARDLDPADPTAWFYAALLRHRENRPNEAIRDLEESTARNQNRRLYRSQLLLDQDRAVRGANLARIYADAGLQDVALSEASRSIDADYANAEAHRFLADSYAQMREARLFGQRYDTAWASEYLLANILAPVGQGTLSPAVSQHEYTRLFEGDRMGFYSSSTYHSRGDWDQVAVQHGVIGNTSYAAEATYHTENGDRSNTDLELVSLHLRVKQQLGRQDSLYLECFGYHSEGGDLTPYFSPDWADPDFRFEETQPPSVFAGYHREWSPGVHTLALAGYLNSTFEQTQPDANLLLLAQGTEAPLLLYLDQTWREEAQIGVFELQQMVQLEHHLFLVGGRFEAGKYGADNRFVSSDANHNPLLAYLADGYAPASEEAEVDLRQYRVYGYYHWQPLRSLRLIAGIGYESISSPANERRPPMSDEEKQVDRWSPKAGLVWQPGDRHVFRAAYAQGLGGIGAAESYRLEPSQVGGFNQVYRSVIPETAAGTLPGAEWEMFGVALEERFPTRTYLVATAERLASAASRGAGAFELEETVSDLHLSPAQIEEELEYAEWRFSAGLHQLLGNCWGFGARYTLSHAELDRRFTDAGGVWAPPSFYDTVTEEGWLHHAEARVDFNHRSGFFGRATAGWYRQELDSEWWQPQDGFEYVLGVQERDVPVQDFWKVDALAGYRFWDRRAELTLGVLNLTDEDYRMDPINLMPYLYRERTLMLQFRIAL